MLLSNFNKFFINGVEMKQLFIDGIQLWKKNWVKCSTEADGETIYNGGLGYKNGYRIRSGGGEGELSYSAHTGFISVNGGDVVRIGGMNFGNASSHASAINVANSNFENIGQFSMTAGEYGIFVNGYNAYSRSSVIEEKAGVWKWIVPPAESGVAHIRISCGTYNNVAADGSELIITINTKI